MVQDAYPMRIIILQGAFFPVPPLLGGAVEKMWFLLGQEFASAGHEVIHISRRHPKLKNEETLFGVQHIRIQGDATSTSLFRLKWRDLCYTLRAIPYIRKANIVITNTFWAPLIFPLFTNAPLYVDVARMPKGQMRLYAGARRLRANSIAVAKAILREWPGAAPKVRIIPNPLPFVPSHEIEPEQKEPTVLYVGRMHEEKGLMLLLEAWSQLPADLSQKWKLQIAGPWQVEMGGSGERFFAQLRSLAENRNVEFLGFLQDISELNSIYENASIFVYPSLAERGETFGLSALEAMAWGCVPVVSSLSCFADFIEHNKNGLIFNHRTPDATHLLNHQLVSLMRNPERRRELAASALQVRISHHISTIAQQFLEDFQSLARKRM